MTDVRRVGLRAYVDRELSADPDGPLWFTAATEGVKQDGIDLRMAGCNLARYQANPVALWAHDRGYTYGHTAPMLPIGRSPEQKIDGDRLLVAVTFDRGDDFAATVERKYREKYLNAVSIGFEVDQWEAADQNYWRGGVAVKWTLTEVSACPVPMDADAVVESGRSLREAPEFAAAVAVELARLGAVELARAGAAPEPPAPKPVPVPEPEPAGVDETAARALLDAAFPSLKGDTVE